MIPIDPRHSLRREMRDLRKALAPMQRMQAAEAVAARLQSLDAFRSAHDIAVYFAVQGELPLLHTVNAARSSGKHLWMPVVRDDGALGFAPWSAAAPMQANRFGIPEPVVAISSWRSGMELDLVLLPLLAFDRSGNRLGTGAGYYDRSFAALTQGQRPRQPILVGVAYAAQEVPMIAAESWDVRLDYVITEREMIMVDHL